jgi:hypothetical protein
LVGEEQLTECVLPLIGRPLASAPQPIPQPLPSAAVPEPTREPAAATT